VFKQWNFVLWAMVFPIAIHARAQEERVSSTGEAEFLEVEKVKEKYWAQGEESQLGVVQNRLYTKGKKFQLGVLGAKAMDDPFLSSTTYGLNVSYNFTEFWGLSLLGWKYGVKASNALKTLRAGGKEANTVEPEHFLGSEATGSFLYGKLSLLGSAIIYYDMHFSAGAGVTKTENDAAAPTVSLGVGQRFYLTKMLSLKIDYRAQTFVATEKEKEITARLGQVNGKVRHWNHVIGMEVNLMFGAKE
jgi:outer membrane beta-barrel protein